MWVWLVDVKRHKIYSHSCTPLHCPHFFHQFILTLFVTQYFLPWPLAIWTWVSTMSHRQHQHSLYSTVCVLIFHFRHTNNNQKRKASLHIAAVTESQRWTGVSQYSQEQAQDHFTRDQAKGCLHSPSAKWWGSYPDNSSVEALSALHLAPKSGHGQLSTVTWTEASLGTHGWLFKL